MSRVSRVSVVVALLVAGIARAEVSAPQPKPKPQSKLTLRAELRHIVDPNPCMEPPIPARLPSVLDARAAMIWFAD
jgi:hypothetical protein